MKNKNGENVSHKVKGSTFLVSIGIVIAVAGATLGILAYGNNISYSKKIVSSFSNIVPLPALIIDGKSITFNEIEKNLSSLRQFYESQDFSSVGLRVDFSTSDGEKRLKLKEKDVINKLVEDIMIERLAQERGIKISKSEVDQNIERKLEEYGTKDDVESSLAKLYGWSLEDFKEKVVLPQMYQEQLLASVEKEIGSLEIAKQKIEKAKSELEKGKDFSEVAKTYSEGESAKEGGQLGWVRKEQLLVELQKALFEEETQNKSIIESSIGFHVVDVEERKKENGADVLKIRQIFVRKEMFSDWLKEKMQERKVRVLIPGYFWNKQEAIVDFDDEEMKKFEKDVINNSEGDASVLF